MGYPTRPSNVRVCQFRHLSRVPVSTEMDEMIVPATWGLVKIYRAARLIDDFVQGVLDNSFGPSTLQARDKVAGLLLLDNYLDRNPPGIVQG